MHKLIHSITAALSFALFIAAPQLSVAQGVRSDTGFVSEDYEVSSVDENGVDVLSGSVRIAADLISIGTDDAGLSYSVITPSLAQTGNYSTSQFYGVGAPYSAAGSSAFKFDNYSGGSSISGIDDCNNWFEYGGNRTDFCGTLSGGLTPSDGSNATLTCTSTECTFTSTDGTVYISDKNAISLRLPSSSLGLKEIIYPNGYKIDIYRDTSSQRVSIVDNRGFQIRAVPNGTGTTAITAFNMAVDYCAPLAATCSFTKSWPTASVYVGSSTQPAVATDMAGSETKLYPRARENGFSGYYFYQVKAAGADENSKITYTFCGPWTSASCGLVNSCGPGNNNSAEACAKFGMALNKVRTAVKEGKTWNYVFNYSKN